MSTAPYILAALVTVVTPTLYALARYDRWCAAEPVRIDKQVKEAMRGA